MNKILIIGCGHMGSAILNTLHKTSKDNFIVVDPINFVKIKKKYKKRLESYKSIDQVKDLTKYNIVIFAVKPQVIENIMKKIAKLFFKKNTLFVSIIAGKKISFFSKYLPINSQIVRVMPNMPALIEEGMSCIVPNKKVSKKNKQLLTKLFNTIGKTLWLRNEKDIDKVTAISGSGPGYFFLFINLLIRASTNLGINEKYAKDLVYQTALGSIKLLIKNQLTSKELINNIAIKGGTTEAALQIFYKNNIFKKIINNAVKNAYKKSIKLGK